jgi:UDP-glucose:(heptosyl)LPS alpha-1,3-glucosyltransferase
VRVALILDRWDPARGGAERAMAKLASHLVARGDEAHVFAAEVRDVAPAVAHVVPWPRRWRGAAEAEFGRRAVEAARAAGCDVTVGVRHLEEVDVYWPHGGLHAATLAAGERARGRIAGGVARTLHRASLKHRAFLRLEETLLGDGGARVVWCVSPLVRDEIASAFPVAAPRLELHANGVDLAAFHPGLRAERRDEFLRRHGLPVDAAVLVFPGGNWGLKGWRVLRDALPRLGGSWLLVAAGAGHERVAAPRDVAARVVLLPRQDPRDLWAAADLCVQPTFRDPCSLATLEALASGVPVVTTSANGASDAVSATGAGAVVAAGDADALAEAIDRELARRTVRTDVRPDVRGAVADRAEERWLEGLARSLTRQVVGREPSVATPSAGTRLTS